jgi:hypothetical protein
VVAVATFHGEHGLMARIEEDDVHRREKGKKKGNIY